MDQQTPSVAPQSQSQAQDMAKDLEAQRIEKLKGEFLGGISWFYWIGGLSLINIAFGVLANRKFIVGLGVTEIFDSLAFGNGSVIGYAWIAASILVSGLFIWLGFLGRKGRQGAIMGGLVFYVLDGALMAFAQDWLAVLFHGYAAFMIFKGFQSLKEILSAADGAQVKDSAS